MSRKRNRRKHREKARYSDAKVTPTHFIRLERLRVIIDADRSWYVIRIDGRQEKKVRRGLEAAGFAVCSPAHTSVVERAGRFRELRQRAAPGYLFVGVERGIEGRTALWAYHDRTMANLPLVKIENKDDHRMIYARCRGDEERPFYAVMGPVEHGDIQKFVECVGDELVAIIFDGFDAIAHFPLLLPTFLKGSKSA